MSPEEENPHIIGYNIAARRDSPNVPAPTDTTAGDTKRDCHCHGRPTLCQLDLQEERPCRQRQLVRRM